MSKATVPPTAEILKQQCRCGHGVDHFWIRPQKHWSGLAWLGIVAGVSMPPHKIDYQCGRCGEILATLTDAETLKQLR